ncbi:MAG: TIGR01212 family radical SAM protein [Lachnospiraceae bacterium]|nr:TIGR01212 family radical SAM protein [Lachnospiraceae bacterium]
MDKPYYSLNAYCKNTLKHKCYKIALNAHMTCPNRDGTLDTRGCIFCSAGGSGDFAVPTSADCHKAFSDIHAQLEAGKKLFGDKKIGEHYIAYFQAYTNTYAPLSYLEEIYFAALSTPEVCGISIATRPDCLPDDVLALFKSLRRRFPEKFIWVELGLQTIHEETAHYIRRGYELPVFEQAVTRLQALDIPVITHVILGLPGETPDMVRETIRYLNTLPIWGIKLQLLHVLKDTDLATDYLAGKFATLEKDEYLTLLIHCIELLRPDIVIHRVTGDGPKNLLIAPTWSLNKRDVLNSLHQRMRQLNTYQGRLCAAASSQDTSH